MHIAEIDLRKMFVIDAL